MSARLDAVFQFALAATPVAYRFKIHRALRQAGAPLLENQLTTLRLTTPIDDDEMQMRRALQVGSPGTGGSRGEQSGDARGTRRFAQAGDVPVTRLAARKDHPAILALAAAEDALKAERQAREHTEATLAQANTTIVTLQTKLAHADMALAEALEDARRHREAEQVKSLQATVISEPRRDPALEGDVQAEFAPSDEEPVQWWVPGWQGGYRSR